MKIGAALGFNLIDYPGKIAAVAFTPGCNYRCPHCHAAPLLAGAKDLGDQGFLDYLDTVKEWVTGVTICGGEPTLQEGLIPFIEQVRARNLSVKLDTNGSSPRVLERLLGAGLVDYVAMDVKGPRFLWPATAGVEGHEEAMSESLRLVSRFPVYEFRTTVAPVVRGGGEISFLTVQEMSAAARLVVQATGSDAHKYYVQKFVPRKDGLLDKRLESFPETPPLLLQEIHQEVLKHLPNTQLRG
ncbi:MAG: anaerobic ribonucleoside-triphosphate reductase activating protein [Elusimicrobia bacterium HGW-Elusimicrobia-3]|jgi:pyruvate formate lyase activating enzyme|nr:MAG: anaerobic ribonucleoside-triphosphate reductase activating protein [Elusimicrobia bacterium HGW-Elusimicrobia-3]